MSYVEIIKELMRTKNLSQAKMASEIGVNQTTVSQWLLGNKKPSFDNIMALYEKFGVTPNELFGLNDE